MRSRLQKSLLLLLSACALCAAACSGEEKARARADAQTVTSATAKKWAFVDAFAALKDRDPARRLEAVEWIGAHLSGQPGLAKEALRAAAADDDPEVAARAKRYLRGLGDSR